MYKINKKILQTPVEDGNILLLEPEAGLYFEMNETSVLIYQGIVDGLNEDQILNLITDKYDIQKQHAQTDLASHITNLLENKIIIEA